MPAETSSHLRTDLQNLLETARAQTVAPTLAAGIIADGKEYVATVGNFPIDTAKTQTVQENTLFDIASLTKSFTAAAALRLVESGDLSLTDSLSDLLPHFLSRGAKNVTLLDLLSFRVEFGLTLSALRDLSPSELKTQILSAPIKTVPSPQPLYMNTTSILTGWILEQVTQHTLPAIIDQYILSPLGMKDTTFYPSPQRCVPTEHDTTWRLRTIQGEVHDESAWILSQEGSVGSAGLFSTVPDLLKLLRCLLDAEHPLFSSQTRSLMIQNQFGPHQPPGGVGWELQAEWMGPAATLTTAGKTGFTGCCLVWDADQQVAGVLLSNAQFPQRRVPSPELLRLRQQFCQMVLRSK